MFGLRFLAALEQFNKIITVVCKPMLEVAPGEKQLGVTSYWFRGVGATLADLRVAPWAERLTLGDWAGKTSHMGAEGGQASMMPLRYARTRFGTEQFAKLLHMQIMSAAMAFGNPPVTWAKMRTLMEQINLTRLREVVEYKYKYR